MRERVPDRFALGRGFAVETFPLYLHDCFKVSPSPSFLKKLLRNPFFIRKPCKGDFEAIEEFHSTQKRQYLVGAIHVQRLGSIDWFKHPEVSMIVLPNGIVEKEAFGNASTKGVRVLLNMV